MSGDYRTRHNAPMPRLFALLCLLIASPAAPAWNAAGHRLVAVIAWEQTSARTRERLAGMLADHPDHARWVARARSDDPAALFAEASTWADDIRNDPRFHGDRASPTATILPGFPDMRRNPEWHYVDFDDKGRTMAGELDRRIELLARQLSEPESAGAQAYALPWLVHLVGDIHQPLHVGRYGDDGGNAMTIENPFNPRQPFPTLHAYWDDLPGPPWLRGKRLAAAAAALTARHPAPATGEVQTWRDESHHLLAQAYPLEEGSLLPIVGPDFHRRSRELAEQRVVAAGYRLGWWLEALLGDRVPRETQ
jgi:hypothetical protein